jgi:DNA polymerase-3 subunit delta
MLRLDGAGAGSQEAAAEVLGIKSPFQAGKALDQLRRLGSSGVRRAIELLATADLDLRGARELPDDVVMEVLVARLSRLAPRRSDRRGDRRGDRPVRPRR